MNYSIREIFRTRLIISLSKSSRIMLICACKHINPRIRKSRPNSAYNQQAEEYNPYLAPNYPFVGKQ
jgi:hypothetical protein